MDREKVLDKVKKLLALSADNPNDEESYSALTKAQALMAQYKIEEGDITPDKKEECIHRRTLFRYGAASSDTYLNELATILADNFCCVNYVSRPRGSKSRYISFMGLEKDINVILEAMTTANDAIIRGYNVVWKDMCKEYDVDYIPAKFFNPAKIGYIDGYLKGLKEVLDSQREKIEEYGLVLVAPQEAQDFINGLGTMSTKPQVVSHKYHDMGYEEGKKFNLNKKIEGK